MNFFKKQEAGTRFRTRLFIGMVLVVLALTSIGLFLVQQEAAREAAASRQKDFQNELADMHRVRDLRDAAMKERCRELAQRPRIHAAFEDNALDVLYLSARDEFKEIMPGEAEPGSNSHASTLKAKFYRFLESKGRLLSPPEGAGAGQLTSEEEAQLSLPSLPESPQAGYLVRINPAGSTADEIFAVPVLATGTGDLIATLVLGFDANATGPVHTSEGLQAGIYTGGHLIFPGLSPAAIDELARLMATFAYAPENKGAGTQVELTGKPYLLAHERINPRSMFPPVYEVTIYPLTPSLAREQTLRWQVLMAGALLLIAGLLASRFLAARLATRVEKLEDNSRENWAQRRRAEAALEMTSEELQRAARFSSDASHQLKTPLTVLRAGLEEIVVRPDVPPDVKEEVSGLVHQTFRLTSIVEDLLLLSRMDARRLQINMEPVNISEIIEKLVDDLSAIPDPLKVEIRQGCPSLLVSGEKRYIALILQNLFENARKYNRPGGEIRIDCRQEGDFVLIVIGNTGKPIPAAARENIFERFHRGTAAENIPGHGLGLNLARELARLHGGDVCLKRSDDNWTEFEVRFRLCPSG